MHLNCHTAYPRLAVKYFRKKLHHMQLFIITAPLFRFRAVS